MAVMTPAELVAAMKALGLKRRDFAEQLRVSMPTVNSWINGRREISPYVAVFFELQNRIRDLESQVESMRALLFEFERERRAAAAE